MKIKSLKDVCGKAETKTITVPNVGTVMIHDVGRERKDALKKFYTDNYRETYPLIRQDFFEWMFRHNDGKVSVLSRDGQILAHQGHVPVIFTNGINDYPSFFSATTMVDKDFRRKKLMSHLRGTVHNRYQMSSSLGGSDQGKKLYSYMGYRALGDLIRVIAVIDPGKCKGLVKNGEGLVRTVKFHGKRSGSQLREIGRFGDIEKQLEQLWERTFPPGTYFAAKRSAEFLDWRYSDHPTFSYKCFGLWYNSVLSAVTVFRCEDVENAGGRTCRVVELFGDENSIVELAEHATLKQEAIGEIAWIDWFCSNPNMIDPLKKIGFLKLEELSPAVFTIFCSPVDYYKKSYTFMLWIREEEFFDDLAPFEKWYITKGDGDADRPNNFIV